MCRIWFVWIRPPPKASGDFEASCPVALAAGEGGLVRSLGVEMSDCGLHRHKSRLCVEAPNAFGRPGCSDVDGKKATVCGNLSRVSKRTGFRAGRRPT